jgi:hypothetical protein
MNEVEPVMGCGDGQDPAGLAQTRKPVTALEMMHECIDALTRGRQMTTDGDIVFGA